MSSVATFPLRARKRGGCPHTTLLTCKDGHYKKEDRSCNDPDYLKSNRLLFRDSKMGKRTVSES